MSLEFIITALVVPVGAGGAGAIVALYRKLGKKDDQLLQLSADNIALAQEAKENAREDVRHLMKAVDAIKGATDSIRTISEMREDINEIKTAVKARGDA